MTTKNPTFHETFVTLFRHYLTEELNTNFPAEIVAYDYKTQMADVQPLVKRHYADGTDLEYPIIPNVPVMMPRAGGAMLKLPVKEGDTVLLVCSKPSLENWLSEGGMSTQNTTKQFQLIDAIAIVGLYPFTEESPATEEDGLELIYGGTRIVIKANGDIELGVGEENLKRLVTEDFMKIFNNHAHNYKLVPDVAGAAGTTGPMDIDSEIKIPPPVADFPFKDPIQITEEHFTQKTRLV